MTKRLEIIFLLASLVFLAACVVLTYADIDKMNGVEITSSGTIAGTPATVSVVGGGAIKSGAWTDPYTPTLWYPFENDRGTVADQSVRGNDAALVGNPVYNYTDASQGLDVNDYISIPDADGMSPATDVVGTDSEWSIVAWLKANDNTDVRIASKWDATREWDWYFDSSAKIGFLLFDAGGHYIGQLTDVGLSAITSDYIMLTATYDGSKGAGGVTIYTNGAVMASSAQSSGVYAGATNQANVVSVNAELSGTPSYGDGYYNGIRIYARELSAQDVSDLFAAGRTNTTVDTISTNNLSFCNALNVDNGVRDLGSGGNTGVFEPTVSDGVWSIIGTNKNGRVDHGESFDASDDFIRISTTSGLANLTNGLTFAGWFKRDQDDATEGLFHRGQVNESTLDMGVDFRDDGDGLIKVWVHEDGDPSIYCGRTAPDFNSGAWHHLAITYQPVTNISIYVDGVRTDNAYNTNGVFTTPNFDATAQSLIGRRFDYSGKYDGLIHDLKLYTGTTNSRPSTVTEINTLMNNTEPPDNDIETGY